MTDPKPPASTTSRSSAPSPPSSPTTAAISQAAAIIALGGGSLVTTVYSDDREFTARAVADIGPQLGRLVLNDEKSAAGAFSPGCVFPQANHGGPGRAGNGAELGGRLGLELYMQRLASRAAPASSPASSSRRPPRPREPRTNGRPIPRDRAAVALPLTCPYGQLT
jgi:hypothetical protein